MQVKINKKGASKPRYSIKKIKLLFLSNKSINDFITLYSF